MLTWTARFVKCFIDDYIYTVHVVTYFCIIFIICYIMYYIHALLSFSCLHCVSCFWMQKKYGSVYLFTSALSRYAMSYIHKLQISVLICYLITTRTHCVSDFRHITQVYHCHVFVVLAFCFVMGQDNLYGSCVLTVVVIIRYVQFV